MWIRICALMVALALPTGAMAADRVVDVSSVEGVAALLKEAGYKAEIKKRDDGGSYIVSGANGNEFHLDFYGCTNDKGCNSFDFYSWYKKEPFFSTAMANEWNASNRFLKVAIDQDGDLAEFLSVSAVGNMTFDNFKDYIEWYGSMDSDLYKFVEEKRAAAKSGK